MKVSIPARHGRQGADGRPRGLVRAARATTAMGVAAAMSVLGVGVATTAAAEDTPIEVPDANLLACINDELGQDPDDDVTEAQAAGIDELYCPNRGIEVLDGIAHLTELGHLSLANNQITDVAPLVDLSALGYLGLTNNEVVDVGPLAGLSALEGLSLHDNAVVDVGPLSGLSALETLNIRDNAIADVGPLTGLSNLDELDLRQNEVVDASPLEDIAASASTFYPSNQSVDLGQVTVGQPVDNPVIGLDGDPVVLHNLYDAATNTFTPDQAGDGFVAWSESPGFSGFAGNLSFTAVGEPTIEVPDAALLACINDELGQGDGDDVTEAQAAIITELTCRSADVEVLNGIETLTELRTLDLMSNGIVDLDPLAGLDALQNLDLQHNEIADVGPLAELESLTTLNLWNNQIADVSALAGLTSLERLELTSNQIVDVSALTGLTSLERLDLERNRIVDVSPLADDIATFLATGQSVDLGDVTVGEAQDNPVVGLDGQSVHLDPDALYDDVTHTFTPDAEGPGSVGWDDGDAFTGTLEFTAVEPVVVDDLQVTASATEVDEGDSVDLTVVGIDDAGAEVDVDEADLAVTSDVDTDVIDGLTVTFPSASEHVLTVTHEPSGATGSVTVTVVAPEEDDGEAELVDLVVTASATEVDEGESVDLTVTGVDDSGDEVGVDEADLVVTSDADTDVIDGLTVTFPSASEHVLTVTHEPSGATGSVTVTVVAAEEEVEVPVDNGETDDPGDQGDPVEEGAPAVPPSYQLAATGTEPAVISGLAVLLLAAGALLLNSRRRAVERI